MGLRISTNMASMAANRALVNSTSEQTKTYKRLATGQRITSAGDDAAGLSISENLRAQIRSMGQAERNANDGISFAQVAEGGLTEIGNIMIRLRELAIQASSDTIGDSERSFVHNEASSLLAEVDRIANVTTFNGTPLLNGEAPKAELEFQVGTRSDEADRIVFGVAENDVRAATLGVDGLSWESVESARDAIGAIDSATGKVFETRARLGAMQNKLQATTNNLGVAKENLSQAFPHR
jgi:flagellin